MFSLLTRVITPLISLFIFVLGSGFFTTLLVLRMQMAHETSLVIGAMSSAYYLGLVIGSFRIERLIIRIGHIRAFAAFASTLAVVSLLHGIYYSIPFWLVLRLVGGAATAGLFVVIESWLLVLSHAAMRGQVLSLYMIFFYAAQAAGQFFINLSSPDNLLLFAITAMLCSLSVIPLAMTKTGQPPISEPSLISFRKLYEASASGIIGCICCGLILSAIYGLMPWFIVEKQHSVLHVSSLMAAVILGGMALQYPLGKISDLSDRRYVLLFITVSAAIISMTSLMVFQDSWLTYLCMFVFGGMTFTIYPVSISLACDGLEQKDLVSGTQALLLAYSIGAAVGPVLAPMFIRPLGANGLFIYFMVVSTLLSLFFIWRLFSTPAKVAEGSFQSIPQTSPITAELDPRTDDV